MTRILASAIALALLGAGAAQAQADEVGTATVHYADLDLASIAGQAELDRRVEVAARQACQVQAPAASRFEDRSELIRCKASVRAQVAAALNI